ncbi:MAG: Sec-independent protein translocase protein TatB [Pigmentiphaga sp.]|uniref:Sec-independent protein translocase protein TatB n=1 Tax=Pigmentiphaga sp. TaxID=1977564 RepID=UPI0029BBC0E7|nr:Sec-independent protein translocase protein TatB [Pigmentiphaga sp.]MDX3908002.1 Sec-independent protein translocase protein TatB [Pigmentiphaga sp.]
MFDVSFTELMTVGVVALIVIGPERLPKVARTIGHLLGRAQRYVNDVKSDIRREMELDELRSLRKEMEDAARALETTVKTNVDDLQKGLSEVQQTVGDAARDVKTAATGSLEAPAGSGSTPGLTSEKAAAPGAPDGEPMSAATPGSESAPSTAPDSAPEHDAAQASLFPPDVMPPAVNQPAAGQPAEASTVRERT